MKRIYALFPLILIAMALYAAPKEITMLASPFAAGDNRVKYAVGRLKADFPDVSVRFSAIDLADGSTMTMDAQLAAGLAPNVYMDTLVRASKYMVPEFALPLDTYVRDLAKYQRGVLDPFRKGGKLYGLPCPGGAQGMAINLDIMDAIGYTVPPRWTIEDFLKMAELVKTKFGGKKYATGMFAANQSGDYLINNWFEAFGAHFYKAGDYSRTTIAETGGAKAYVFFQLLAAKGYIPPGSATLNDDDYALSWSLGEYAATAFFPGWMDSYWKTAIEQGAIKAPFRVAYVPFPRAPGVENVPTYFSGAGIVVHRTGTEADAWAARLAEYLNDSTAQDYVIDIVLNVGNRVDTKPSKDAYVKQVAGIIAAGGIMDCGLTSPKFAATRPQHFPVLQKVLNGKITPEAAIKEYEAKLNGALK